MKNVLIPISVLFLLPACKKDTNDLEPGEPVEVENAYYPMKTGNYWVYEYESYDADGNPTGDPTTIDTIAIVGDTIIEGNTYFTFQSDFPFANSEYYQRDSAGHIIYSNGNVILQPAPRGEARFNEAANTDGAGDTIWASYQQYPQSKTHTVPAGTFYSLEEKVTFDIYNDDGEPQRYVDYMYYAQGVGQTQRSLRFIFGGQRLGKLIDYHLE